MKSFLVIVAVTFQLTLFAEKEFPELRFGHLRDRSLAALSFTKKIPDHVKLTNEHGDSSTVYTIVSGTLECFDTGEKEQLKTGGYLSDEAKFMLANAKPGIYKISVYCKSVDMSKGFETSLIFALGMVPVVNLATIKNADTLVLQTQLDTITRIQMGYPAYAGMNNFFNITEGTLKLDGLPETGNILPGGKLDKSSLELLKNSAGNRVIITLHWTDGTGVGRIMEFWFAVLPKE